MSSFRACVPSPNKSCLLVDQSLRDRSTCSWLGWYICIVIRIHYFVFIFYVLCRSILLLCTSINLFFLYSSYIMHTAETCIFYYNLNIHKTWLVDYINYTSGGSCKDSGEAVASSKNRGVKGKKICITILPKYCINLEVSSHLYTLIIYKLYE